LSTGAICGHRRQRSEQEPDVGEDSVDNGMVN
jgi:hypothetical protein